MNCPECRSTDTHFRKKRNDWICDECNHHWPAEKKAPGIEDASTAKEPFQPLKIFLSYGHDQHAADAERIKADLEARGHTVWFDLERLRAGRDWEQYIEEGLKDCDKVILLMTPYSVRRRKPGDVKSADGYCLNELAKAIERNKLIIPVLLVELDEGPPVSICRIQYLDLTDAVPIHEREETYEQRFDRLLRALEYDELDFEGGQQRLNRLLRPLNFDAQISRHIARFTGRVWLFQRLDDWLEHRPESRVFWIVGGPGIGKSAITAQLCHRRGDVVASHFCVHGHQDKADSRRVVFSLAYQLAMHLPAYQRKLHALALEEEQTKDAQTLFDNLIVAPLSGVNPSDDRHRLVVIDAIDEATRDGRNEVADFIARNWSSTPPWLRLVITSRPESEVITRLKRPDLNPFVLDAESEENLTDLRDYLRRDLAKLELSPDAATVAAILAKSEGVFLYVTTLIEELLQGHLSIERVEDFPQGMAGYYQTFFARQFPNVQQYEREVAPLLGAIIVQREPLPLELLEQVTALSTFELGKRLSKLGSLFPVRNVEENGQTVKTISPFHKSIGDWLIAEDPLGGFAAGIYAVDTQTGRHQLADACYQQYQSDISSLSAYALRQLLWHLIATEQVGEVYEVLTNIFFLEAKN